LARVGSLMDRENLEMNKESHATRRKNWKRSLIGIFISVACLGFIASRINLAEVKDAISHFHWPYLIVGLLSLAAGYSMRIVRWCVMLRAAGARISPTDCVAPFLGTIALNNVLPLRLGDVMRALVFPSAIGIDKTSATGSLVMERLVDLMTLLVCLTIGLALNQKAQLPPWIASTAISLALFGGTALVLLFLFSGALSRWCSGVAYTSEKKHQTRINRLIEMASNLLGSFDSMSRAPVLLALFSLSMLVWVGEAGLYWSLLVGFGLQAGPETAVITMAIATLSTLVPSSPGYVGPFHLAAYTALAMLGGTPAQAASFAVLSHLSVWLPTTLAGAVALLTNPQLFSSVKTSAAAL